MTMTRKEILKGLKTDVDSGMFGWIGEFTGTSTNNHNMGCKHITLKMVEKLENEGVIEYNGLYDVWAAPIEIIKSEEVIR